MAFHPQSIASRCPAFADVEYRHRIAPGLNEKERQKARNPTKTLDVFA
jgi:hypothetical protein